MLSSLELISKSQIIFFICLGLLLFASMVILIMNLTYLQNNKYLVSLINAKLLRANHITNQLESCQMENATLIKNIFEDEGFSLLNNAFDRYIQNSQKVYQNKWMLDPQEYFNLETLLTSKEYNNLHNDTAFRQLSLGLFISTFSLILPLLVSIENSYRLLPFAILPASISIAFFFLLYHKNRLYIHELNYTIKSLKQTINRRLPVFSDLAGSAVLVDAFIQYDKQMSKSVQRLSTTVSSLLNHEMVNAISETISQSIETSLSPTLKNSHELLLDLGRTVTTSQVDGMKVLAEQFSNNLSEQIAHKLEPFYHQINAYARSLDSLVDDMHSIKGIFQDYQQQAAVLDHSREQHMQNWEVMAQKMNQATNEVAMAQTRLAAASDRLSKLQGDGEQSLVFYIQQFAGQLDNFKNFLDMNLQNTRKEQENTRNYLVKLIEQQQASLNGLEILSNNLIENSQNLHNQSSTINSQLETLNHELNEAVNNFNTNLVTAAQKTLDTFDDSLAEINDRLSTSISEIKQILPK